MDAAFLRSHHRITGMHEARQNSSQWVASQATLIRAILIILTATVPAMSTLTVVAETEPETWDYVALGDSLTVGVGSSTGYVYRYAEMIEQDLGVDVRPVNFGSLGATSGELLMLIRTNQVLRDALGTAEIVTWNIGGNDLSSARDRYKRGSCGGEDNQDCLRDAETSFLAN